MSHDAQIVGCFILHLYCGECRQMGEFTGENRQQAIKQAKECKWDVRWGRDYARCPAHTLTAKLTAPAGATEDDND